MTKDEHIALLKTAITANVTARLEHDKRQQQEAEPRGEPPAFEVWEAADFANPARLDLDPIIKDPVRKALRVQLKTLGRRLFDLLVPTPSTRGLPGPARG